MHQKGQSAIEFMALVSLTLLILTALMSATTQKQAQTNLYSNQLEAQSVAQDVAFQAEMALVHGNYYHRDFTVPNTIGGQNYTIYIVPSAVAIELNEDGNMTMPTLYAGETLSHQVEVSQNDLRIKHNDTGVYLHEEE